MLKIVLNDGTEYVNDPKIGHNLETKEAIQEVIAEVGYYEILTKTGWDRVYRNEIKEIV